MTETEQTDRTPEVAASRWRTGRIVQSARWLIVGALAVVAGQWLWTTMAGEVTVTDAAVALDGIRGQDDVVWAVSGPFLVSGRVDEPGGSVESGWWLVDEMVAVTPADDPAGWADTLVAAPPLPDDVPWRSGVELLDGWVVAPHDRVVPLGDMVSRRTVLSPSGVVDGVASTVVEVPAEAAEMLWSDDETVDVMAGDDS